MANPVLTALLALLAAPGILDGVTNSFPPFAAGMARKGYKEKPNLIPSTGELVTLRLKRIITKEKYLGMMRQAGYGTEVATDLLEGTKSYLSVFDYVSLWRRGEIDRQTLDSNLAQMGFDSESSREVIASTEYLPSPQDLIRFTVRDVYTPATAQEYGLFEDFPEEMVKRAAQVGLSEQTAKEYWAAHWELPSPTQVFNMLHRGILTEDQTKMYLRAADYMPWWRDKMIKLSYDPLTRVDVRRMRALNLITRDEVVTAYKELGYDQRNAERLALFVETDIAHTEEKTPQGNVLAAYKAGVYTREVALQKLIDSGYTNDTGNAALDTADSDIKQELIDLQADAIIDQYIRGGIDLAKVRSELTLIGVPPRAMELTIQRELAQAKKRQKLPSKADLDAWYHQGLIGDIAYRKTIESYGFSKRDSLVYLSELRIEEVQGKEKKAPYAEPMRKFQDGLIALQELTNELDALKLEPTVIDTLVGIAIDVKG